MHREDPALSWWKSSYSGNNGACLEVALPDEHSIAVRDSKDLAVPSLSFPSQAWSAFVAEVNRGAFTRP
ncbi:DUF397 domain-containing protein [Streptomyces sp. NBC_01537]|jgi:hypothetical protein|uniref:DUF397 domain-containing protein n=1 Tax=Streptomyces sp. NBC_01537 TaxID=2903896 RepID=UPI00386BF3C9